MTAPLTIDEPIAAIIREAMAAVRAGRLRDACAIGEEGLRDGEDSPPLRAFLGALLVRMGDFKAALPHLDAAAQASPDDAIIRRHRATALVALERYLEAADLLTDAALEADGTPSLLGLRAYAAHMGGRFEQGIADYRGYLDRNTADWEAWNNLGNAFVSVGRLDEAVDALSRAAAINPRAAPTRLNLARSLRDLGEAARAEEEFRSMARDFPADPNPLIDLYHLLRAHGRPESEAEELLAEAVRRDPGNPALLNELGTQQMRAFRVDQAEATYRQLLALEPASVDAFLGLAQVFEYHQPERLPALVKEAEADGIGDEHRLNLIRAFAARRAGDHEAGLSALAGVPHDVEPVIRWHLAGQMYDAVGRNDEAFAAFSAMNKAQAENETSPIERAAELRRQLAARLVQLTPEWRASWKAGPVASQRAAPVFLAGFPRSGTTLLDTMLMGHRDVAVIEEKPIFHQLEVEFGSFDALADLSEETVSAMQRRYFELASGYAEIRGETLLIDKSPLYLQRVPQILRLFPGARFILAIRHPADSILSCFMLQNSMANFLDLSSAAEFYDLTFGLWERSRELFDFEANTIVYERMVENPEAELRLLAEALGLQWDPQMLDHRSTARDRGVIPTASYAQVTEPLYMSSVGRWKNYRKHLEPILPRLEPWVLKFGYSL